MPKTMVITGTATGTSMEQVHRQYQTNVFSIAAVRPGIPARTTRAVAWLNGTPLGTTRISHLARLDLAA